MKRTIFAMAAAAAATIAAVADGTENAGNAVKTGGADRVERTKKLVGEFKDSVAMVAVYFKPEADGTLPEFAIPYMCPNCNSTHYHDAEDFIKEGRPFLCAGFVISADEVLVQDMRMRSKWVDRIEVRFGSSRAKYSATPEATYPDEGAMLLKTEKPIEGAKPLEFAKGAERPKSPAYFYLVNEDGLTVAGIRGSQAGDFKHYVELGRDIASGVPNTIVVGDDDRPVTVAMQKNFDLGGEVMVPPTEWKRGAADATDRACADIEKVMAASVISVYVRLDAKENGRGELGLRRWRSGDDAVRDENDACGYVMDAGTVLVPLKMTAEEISRLAKIEATLPDGTKTDLEFVGSVDKYGAIVAKFPGVLPEGLKPFALYGGKLTDLFLTKVVCAMRQNVAGKIIVKTSLEEVDEFAVGYDEKLVMKAGSGGKKAGMVFRPDGSLVTLMLPVRSLRKKYGDKAEQVYGEELALLMSGRMAYNKELVPRTGEDRIRTAWLGVDVQPLTDSVAREKKVTAFLHAGVTDTEGALVTKVYPGTSAAELGIKDGDVLLDVRVAGNENRKPFEAESGFSISDIDWNEVYEKAPLEMFERVPVTPWPSVASGINETLTEIGIGEKVIVAWVSGGERKEGEIVLKSAPTYFSNAPKVRNKNIGLVVKDMTFEVRGYFRFEDADPGVVIAKVKPGSPAAIAGLKPYEIVTEVDGVKVSGAKAFSEAVKDKKEITLSVRRLTATRMVKISVK